MNFKLYKKNREIANECREWYKSMRKEIPRAEKDFPKGADRLQFAVGILEEILDIPFDKRYGWEKVYGKI